MSLTAPQRDLLMGEYDNMLACVRCGLCLTSCPTYVLTLHEAEGPRGRIAMMRALVEGQIEITPELVRHEQNCLVCDACTAVCPAGVHMDPMQVALRAALEPSLSRPVAQRTLRRLVFRRVFADMPAFRRLVRLLRLYQRSGVQWFARRSGILKLLRLDAAEGMLPPIPEYFVVPRGEIYPAVTASACSPACAPDDAHRHTDDAADGPHPSTERAGAALPAPVALFAGCVMSTALAAIDRATIRVLQRAGCDVENTAGQGCCGALNAHGGDLEGAKALAMRNIDAFERGGDVAIVCNSAGCGAMLKDYAHHFRDDPRWAGRAAAFSARVRDVSEFLAVRDIPMRRGIDVPVTYQEPCHLAHAQRISRQPRELLRRIPGLQLREMTESTLCCGSAGVYNLTNPRESRQLQQRKLDHALATEAEVIVTANPGCLLQLRGGLVARGSTARVAHLVELLDEASAP